MQKREARGVAVFEVIEIVAEHDACRIAVCVKQGHRGVRLAGQHRFGDRQAGRDAGPGGEQQVIMLAADLGREAALRRHHLDAVADFQRLGEAREAAILDPLDADGAAVGFTQGRADRVGAAHVLAIDVGAQCQVLAGQEGEGLATLFRNGEADGCLLYTSDAADE